MKCRAIIIITLLLLANFGFGQTRSDYINTADLYEGRADIVAGVRIAMQPGFHAVPGSMVHAYISEEAPPSNVYHPSTGDLNEIGDNPTNTKNYIKTTTLHDIVQDESDISKMARTVEIEYLDFFGQPEMTILVKGSPNQKDLVSNILKYDIGDRIQLQYLPCEVNDIDGKYQNNIFQTVGDFYSQGILEGKDTDTRPFRQSLYDNSPLNRDAGHICEGSHWASHPAHVGYKCNSSTITHWKANANNTYTIISYPIGALRHEEYTDEDGLRKRVFTDNMGQKIRTETVATDGTKLRTVYIYDDFGHLRCVVPPNATSPEDTGFCYYYTYDNKGRIIEKTIPDHGTERCVYDRRNRMVMSQDGNMQNNAEWAFSMYDAFSRVVTSGYLSSNLSREQIQALFDNQTVMDEQWTNSGNLYGYSGISYPASIIVSTNDVQTVFWYDAYDFLNLFSQNYACPNYPSGETVTYTTQTKGFLTGSMDKANLHQADIEMLHVSYYDNKGHLLCSVNDNHLGGQTKRFFKYNFIGQVTNEAITHAVDGQTPILTQSRYTYDHTGRKMQEFYQVDDTPEFLTRAYEYNAVGDLLNTYLYSTNGGNTFAQKLKYHYNIQGWMKRLNDFENPGFDLLALQLTYESPNVNLDNEARYNGNISQLHSNGRFAIPFGYGFTYDKYDRLCASYYAEGTDFEQNNDAYSEDTWHDGNGNITWLWRKLNGEEVDALTYHYYAGTNRLAYIVDDGEAHGGYNASIHPYTYDANGNPTYDPSRHATIAYNHLNQPTTVRLSPDDQIRYSYTSTGTKLRKEVTALATPKNRTTDYSNEFLYEDNELVCIFAPFGRIRPMHTEENRIWQPYYNLTDHLGNVRAEFTIHDSGQPELVQQTDYYPYGYTLRRDNFGSQHPNRRLYGGKELQDETLAGNTLDWYDFEARMYDPIIGRFMTTDAKAEDYYDISPYAYCINNPVNAFDPDGNNPVFMALLLKGLVGAAVDASAQVSISMINGKSFKEAVGEIDYTSVGAAFVFSAIAAPGASTGAKAATGISKSAKVATGIRNGAKGLAIGVDAAIDINANGEVYSWAGILGENKNVSSIAIDAVALIVPEIVVDNVSSGLSKAIEKDLTSKSAATLPKEVKATMRHTKDVIDNKRIPGEINNFVDFSAGLISGQAKKVIDPPNAKSTSSYRPPMILAPQKNDKAEQSIYQKMIYSK